jgi:hypothetical protein
VPFPVGRLLGLVAEQVVGRRIRSHAVEARGSFEAVSATPPVESARCSAPALARTSSAAIAATSPGRGAALFAALNEDGPARPSAPVK